MNQRNKWAMSSYSLASDAVAGFPMTSLFSLTPEAAMWNRAELGQVLEDVSRRPLHVVYSDVPSVKTSVKFAYPFVIGMKVLTIVELHIIPVNVRAYVLVDFEVAASAPVIRREPRCDGYVIRAQQLISVWLPLGSTYERE
jgi:hypothetical protein